MAPLIGDLDITILREKPEGFYPDRNLVWAMASSSRPRMSGPRCGSRPQRRASAGHGKHLRGGRKLAIPDRLKPYSRRSSVPGPTSA